MRRPNAMCRPVMPPPSSFEVVAVVSLSLFHRRVLTDAAVVAFSPAPPSSLVALFLLLALSSLIPIYARSYGAGNVCDLGRRPNTRPHIVSILEFGAVGDGKAFQNAVFYLKSFGDKGSAQLYVPPGRWLTGSFNLTSHLTLFLEKDAVILASQIKKIHQRL